jgi:ankyrin repeat protein
MKKIGFLCFVFIILHHPFLLSNIDYPTPLMEEVIKGDKESIERIIAETKGAALYERTQYAGTTALTCAAGFCDMDESKRKDIVLLLLLEGPEIDLKDNAGNTPFIYAVLRGRKDIAELLFSKGADVNANNSKALYYAIEAGNAKFNRTEMVDFLLSKGAEVNMQGLGGWTAVVAAAFENYVEIVELLVARGADVNKKTNDGITALMNAVGNCNMKITKLLISYGANVNASDNYGETVLMYAASRSCKNIVELLLSKGANINARNNKGKTALISAQERDKKEIVELLRSRE